MEGASESTLSGLRSIPKTGDSTEKGQLRDIWERLKYYDEMHHTNTDIVEVGWSLDTYSNTDIRPNNLRYGE